jgi:hypothetical protein
MHGSEWKQPLFLFSWQSCALTEREGDSDGR